MSAVMPQVSGNRAEAVDSQIAGVGGALQTAVHTPAPEVLQNAQGKLT